MDPTFWLDESRHANIMGNEPAQSLWHTHPKNTFANIKRSRFLFQNQTRGFE
jgi:hypothetical protein